MSEENTASDAKRFMDSLVAAIGEQMLGAIDQLRAQTLIERLATRRKVMDLYESEKASARKQLAEATTPVERAFAQQAITIACRQQAVVMVEMGCSSDEAEGYVTYEVGQTANLLETSPEPPKDTHSRAGGRRRKASS